jgi:ketosteroid isomerase-like protein
VNRATIFAGVAILTLMLGTGVKSAPSTQADIQAALDASAANWSAGKLDEFMALYDDSPETVFVGGDKIISGYRAIHDLYAGHYGTGDAKAMGHLTVEIVDFRQLEPATAFVVLRYHLQKDGAPKEATGLSTLIFRKLPAGWRIVSDHSD